MTTAETRDQFPITVLVTQRGGRGSVKVCKTQCQLDKVLAKAADDGAFVAFESRR